MITVYLPDPTEREKLYQKLSDSNTYWSFSYLDRSQRYYVRTLYNCQSCKNKWTIQELDHDLSDGEYWIYVCPECNTRMGDTVCMDADEYQYKLNNMVAYSQSKSELTSYREQNNFDNAKKVKMVFEPPDGPCCPSKRSVQFDFMKSG